MNIHHIIEAYTTFVFPIFL